VRGRLLRLPRLCWFGATIGGVDADASQVQESTTALIDEYRSRCLWFLRSDYYPTTVAERIKVLEYIERYGDVDAYRRASDLKQWLLRNSSAPSAGS
jgi:hypothetical protein